MQIVVSMPELPMVVRHSWRSSGISSVRSHNFDGVTTVGMPTAYYHAIGTVSVVKRAQTQPKLKEGVRR
jgi:hypothetical protein